MAIGKLVMANVVCRRNRLDGVIRDLILMEKCEFIDTFLEIDDGDFSIGISEENADEILDMEDIVPLKENKEIEQVIQKLELTLGSLDYKPKVDVAHMQGAYTFEDLKDEVEKISCDFALLTEEIDQIESRIETLESLKVFEAIKNIDVDLNQLYSMKHFTVKLGFLTREKAKRISQNYDNIKAIVLHAGTYDEKEFYIIVSPKSLDVEMGRILRSTDFYEINLGDEPLGTPKSLLEALSEERQALDNRILEIKAVTDSSIENKKHQIDKLYSKLMMERKVDKVHQKIAVTENLAYLSAWLPSEDMEQVKRTFGEPPETLVTFKKAEEVSIRIPTPTFLKNSRFFRPFEMLVNMYGVPMHNETDPTFFFGITYMVLFGAMFGDLGQGLVIALAGMLLRKKVNPAFCGILTRIGIGSMFFGFLYDSFFGYENVISTLIPLPIYFRPIENINQTLIIAIVIGIVLMFISYIYSIVNKLRLGDIEEGVFGRNGINGLILLATLLTLVYGMFTGQKILPTAVLNATILVSVVLLLVKQPLSNKLLKSRRLYDETPSAYYVEGIFNLFETFLGMISNTASFIRVGAFALNHVGLFIAFHTLANMIGSTAGNITMFILGNVIVLALEGLVVFIQGLRLFYYELFSKYYTGDGILFTPDKI
ncbi:MAG TPA: V-type ATP synthase subunit I [Clostridiales bacterium UBA8960]|nr:V-type ATP synthase subunit I [Clostridiales bacterium UBA8960]